MSMDVNGCRWMLMDVDGNWRILTFIHDVLYDDQCYQDMPDVFCLFDCGQM